MTADQLALDDCDPDWDDEDIDDDEPGPRHPDLHDQGLTPTSSTPDRRARPQEVPVTPAQRSARAYRTIAAGLSLSSAYAVTHHWLYGLPGVVSASVLLAVAQSCSNEDRRIRPRHEQLRRAARVDEQLLPPAARTPRHGPPLDDQERAAFDEITTHYDHGTAA
ncbi:hypothetical protein AB0I06_34290 [Streptomyces sp. NPDC050674]|uniref:hypothetical protein n=1 Tax=Streptomyces sp. NPDC050674 TaxID=3157216 RepID=UPI00344A7D3E